MTNKGYSTKCPYCKEIINLRRSSYVQKLQTRIRTQRETLNASNRELFHMRTNKNGVIQKMHLMITDLMELLPKDKIEEFKKISQLYRDEIKMIENGSKNKVDKKM